MTEISNISKAGFQPLHDAHAIDQVVFVVQVDRPLSVETMRSAIAIADSVAVDLPAQSQLQGVTFEFNTGGHPIQPAQPAPTPTLTGKSYRRVRPNATIEAELVLELTSIVFRSSSYTRWTEIWTSAKKYFDAIAPMYAKESRISGIGLNYVDRFYWAGHANECKASQLLRNDSDFVAPHVRTATDLWHSHTGSFIKANDQTKRLMNVNVDFIDEHIQPPGQLPGTRKAVVISTILTDFLNQPGFKPLDISKDNANSVIDMHMQELHQFGKMTLSNIISDEMSKRIALKT